MNTMVLGGNGFIGSHLVDKLLAEGHTVSVYDKYEEHFRKPLETVKYFYGDFGNRGLLSEALNNTDVVFHLVNTTLPKTSNDDPVFDVQSNVIESLFLLEQCVTKKVKKIVFTSSGGAVYGKQSLMPISEACSNDPECSYGITKLTIEKYLALYHHLYGLDYCIVRPSNPFGSRQNPSGIQGAISVFLGKVAKHQPIEIWGDGNIIRDFIYIKDLVEGIYSAAMLQSDIKIFNLGSGIGTSLNEIISHIQIVCNSTINVKYLNKRIFDVQEIVLDISRAKEVLKWEPKTPIALGIKETWDFISALNGYKI